MKKLLILAALAAVALVPAVAQAGPIPLASDRVEVGDLLLVTDYNNSNFGGPFQVDNQTIGSPDGWLTFCVEAHEPMSFGVPYLLVAGIGDTAYFGGVGPAGDPLDERTAYLFSRYRAMGGSTDVALNNAYQDAIWFIEGEGGANNALVAEANLAVAPGGSWYQVGLGQVRVLNLVWAVDFGTAKKGDRAQDILTVVPDGGATLMLLGGALVGLGALRRKFRA